MKRWVKQQQKTEPCFICRQLGHWSQECPYRNKAPRHTTNVTFPTGNRQADADWDFLRQCAQSESMYKGAPQKGGRPRNTFMTTSPSTSITTNEIYWSLAELGDKMILDLGCMKTVAGTTWVNPLVWKWKRNGWYCKVISEKESFRFGDGHINQSKFAVIIHVNLAGIPCLLRISVVAGNCPPLLSKPVCTTLGLMVDTSAHAVTSKKYGIKRFGLGQSAGGHYVIPIDQVSDMQPVPSDFSLQPQHEVFPLVPSGSTVKESPTSRPTVLTVHSVSDDRQQPMGERRDAGGRDPRHLIRRGSRSAEEDVESSQTQGIENFVGEPTSITEQNDPDPQGDGGDAGTDGSNGNDNDGNAGDGNSSQSQSEEPEQGGGIWSDRPQGEQEGGPDRSGGRFPDSVTSLQLRRHLQHPRQHHGAGPDVQVEAFATHAEDETGSGGRQVNQEMEEEPEMDHAHERQIPGGTMGPPGQRPTVVLQPEGLPAGSSRYGGEREQRQAQRFQGVQLTDPNAPTTAEQRRRAAERLDVVLEGQLCHGGDLRPGGALHEELHQTGDLSEELHQTGAERLGRNLLEELLQSGGLCSGRAQSEERSTFQTEVQPKGKKITLNRRHTRSIRQGVQKALRMQHLIYEAAQMKRRPWILLEVFAGKATLSSMARQSPGWEVLPPQDVLYGLDLLKEEHVQLLKDVIEKQRPDVVTLSPPCGPWSFWQRMRKRKDLLQALCREHQPFWDLVCWIWAFQNTHGGIVVLEQPKQSDALKMPKMTRRERVYEKEVHMCQLGLEDVVSGTPHKKATTIQMNHPMICTTLFPEMKCDHPPGAHQPLEGSVAVWDETTRRYRAVRRSTLAAEWTPSFCDWLLGGLEAMQEESAQVFHLDLHREVPSTKLWETVPTELEQTPRGTNPTAPTAE